jgi:NAD(P)-dependent dehydrogenase (short-subunit alcohol dehydrogenase family)
VADRITTALVTGAASGIGRCFAETLGLGGVAVRMLDVSHTGLTLVAAGMPSADVRFAAADVADRSATHAAIVKLVEPDGRLDLLVHCAAVLGPGTWAAQPPDDFERVVRVDLFGTSNVVRSALPWLQMARGRVVTLASTAALHGWPGLGAYAAAKFAVSGLADAMRGELRRDGVGMTVVYPLLVDTPLLNAAELAPILRRGRRLRPERVVRATLRGAARRKARIYVPRSVRVIAALHGLAPGLLDWYGRRYGIAR